MGLRFFHSLLSYVLSFLQLTIITMGHCLAASSICGFLGIIGIALSSLPETLARCLSLSLHNYTASVRLVTRTVRSTPWNVLELKWNSKFGRKGLGGVILNLLQLQSFLRVSHFFSATAQ